MSNKHTPETCPNCGCYDNIQKVDSWPLGGEDGIYYSMLCNECGTEWEEHYERIAADSIFSVFIGHKNIKHKPIKDRLVYVEETYAGETETWLDPVTGDHYHVPIRIVRDWDDAQKL